MKARTILALALAAPLPALAYCVHNQLPDREVFVEQEMHRDRLREDRIFRHAIAPGKQECCFNLDCNPGGRPESINRLFLLVRGEPEYRCGVPVGAGSLNVTGDGVVRVLPNPRYPRQSNPYIVRIRSRDKDFTGPRGIACVPTKPPAPKGN